LAGAPGGSPVTVSVTFTEATKTFTGYGASFTYLNVSSVGPLQTSFGNSAAGSLVVPSAPGNLVWGTVFNASGNVQSAFSLTLRQQEDLASNFPIFQAGDTPGAANVTVAANLAGSFYWAAAGLNLVGLKAPQTNNIDVAMTNSSTMR